VREIEVSFAELIRVFENSSPYSEYYLDLGSGEIHFFSTMDFPEHVEVMRKMDENKERFVKLPKLTRGFSKQVIMDFICTVNDPYLKELLEKALSTRGEIRQLLMEFEEPRRRWYKLQNEKYISHLKDWFTELGIHIIDRPHQNSNIKPPS
jgi:hypothetical protein